MITLRVGRFLLDNMDRCLTLDEVATGTGFDKRQVATSLYRLVREDWEFQQKIPKKPYEVVFVKAKSSKINGGPAWGAYNWRSYIDHNLCDKINVLLKEKFPLRIRTKEIQAKCQFATEENINIQLHLMLRIGNVGTTKDERWFSKEKK